MLTALKRYGGLHVDQGCWLENLSEKFIFK